MAKVKGIFSLFYLNITLDGQERLSRYLINTRTRLKNFTIPLRKSGEIIMRDVKQNFQTQGGLVGGWQPLKPATIKSRISAGFGASPVLVNTGAYRDSFESRVSSKRLIVGSFGVDYHKYHQSTKPRTKIPRRQTLFLREDTKREIVRHFQEYIRYGK